MSCQNNAEVSTCQTGGSGYIIIIVLYILLAIILGAAIAC